MLPQVEGRLADLREVGYCLLRGHFSHDAVLSCRDAVWPLVLTRAAKGSSNRGPSRFYFPMPFDGPAFQPVFFFDPAILAIVRGAMGERVVADQWGCDVPVRGSTYQALHVDFARPLFEEAPEQVFPPYFLAVSFALQPITAAHGPIEIAPRTHRMSPNAARRAVEAKEVDLDRVTMEVGDVLVRHPWALHRGSPNTEPEPRALVTVRYVRKWYADDSREVCTVPHRTWELLTPEQQALMRFPRSSV